MKAVPPDPISQEGYFWVLWADMDWVAARVVYLERNAKLYAPAGLLAHKALEQYLKAFLRSHGDAKEWRGRKGHDLPLLTSSCEVHDEYFRHATIKARFQMFYDVYLAWEYPRVAGTYTCDPVMGGDNLGVLDELVANIRPRIKLADLHLPGTFEACHGALEEGNRLVQGAKEENHRFAAMEADGDSWHPPPQVIGPPRQ